MDTEVEAKHPPQLQIDEDDTLHNVDLTSLGQQPVLSFHSPGEDDEETKPTTSATCSAEASSIEEHPPNQPEGTELHKRQTRSFSETTHSFKDWSVQHLQESQKKIAKNGETLLSSMKFFVSNVHTLSAKAMEDTLITAKAYETTRVLYDAYRSDLEAVQKAANTSQAAAARVPAVRAEFEKHKKRYEQLRFDLDIKMKLLDENRV
ncbi:arfaptin-2-like [Gigantopelta aegis]|uniref:arfaptin-2-like n=1 Tax=Gigantopelta aegis TaxID=1735272 RepID=UPI001B8896FA|nr:arfaptin-2-like [Gigantopelta aegis]